jgi:insulysin
VNQEFFIHKQAEGFLLEELCKSTRNPENPFNKFSCGNLDTLKNVNSHVAKEWFNKHYSSNKMKLIIASSKPLEELKALCDLFEVIPNRNLPPKKISPNVMQEKNLGQIVYMDCKKNTAQLNLEWQLPAYMKHQIKYLSFLLTSKHQRSLSSFLEKKGLASDVFVESEPMADIVIFKLIIVPTSQGIQKLHEVLTIAYQYIALIKEQGVSETIFYNWQKDLSKTQENLVRADTSSLVFQLSQFCFSEDFSTFPQKHFIGQSFDSHSLIDLFNYLTAKNCQHILVAPFDLLKIKPQQEGPFFKARFKEDKIPLKEINKYMRLKPHKDMQLPFIENKESKIDLEDEIIELKPLREAPKKILSEEGFEAYYVKDTFFHTKDAFASFFMTSPKIDIKMNQHIALTFLFIEWLKIKYENSITSQNNSNLSIEFNFKAGGIHMGFFGMSEHFKENLSPLLEKLQHTKITKKLFTKIKESFLELLISEEYEDVFDEALDIKESLLCQFDLTVDSLREGLKKITYQDFENFSKAFFSEGSIKAFFYGNLSIDQSIEIAKTFKQTLNITPFKSRISPEHIYLLLDKKKGPYTFSKNTIFPFHVNLLLIQNDKYTPKDYVALELLKFTLEAPFFKELRTKKQTCYELKVVNFEDGYTLALAFMIKSISHKPSELNQLTEEFIELVLKELTTKIITKEQFEKAKKLHRNYFEKKPKSFLESAEILEKFSWYYAQDLQWMSKIETGIQNITYEEFISFTRKLLNKNNTRRLSIQLTGNIEEKMPSNEKEEALVNFIKDWGTFIDDLLEAQKAA